MNPLYSELGIEYQQAYSGPYIDRTVKPERGTLIVAEQEGRLSGFGRPAIVTGKADAVYDGFLELYDRHRNIWYADDLSEGVNSISRYLLKQGQQPKVYMTQVIDLDRSIEIIHADFRKSFRNLANKYETFVSDDPEDIWKLKAAHLAAFGHQTRSDETWRIQGRMIDQGEAFIIHDLKWRAAALFIYDADLCCYGVCAAAIEAHPLIWHAIRCAQKHLCLELEMGEQIFHGDMKAVSVAGFKRGFGGQTRVRLEFGQKYVKRRFDGKVFTD
jgi:hypothetical protein